MCILCACIPTQLSRCAPHYTRCPGGTKDRYFIIHPSCEPRRPLTGLPTPSGACIWIVAAVQAINAQKQICRWHYAYLYITSDMLCILYINKVVCVCMCTSCICSFYRRLDGRTDRTRI